MNNVVLNGYEVFCLKHELLEKPLYAIYAKEDENYRMITDDISVVWEYCYSHERGD